MLFGWEGNRRSGVELAVCHRLSGLSTYRLKGQEGKMSTPPIPPREWHISPFTLCDNKRLNMWLKVELLNYYNLIYHILMTEYLSSKKIALLLFLESINLSTWPSPTVEVATGWEVLCCLLPALCRYWLRITVICYQLTVSLVEKQCVICYQHTVSYVGEPIKHRVTADGGIAWEISAEIGRDNKPSQHGADQPPYRLWCCRSR